MLLIETVYTVGICMFAFRVLPLIDDSLQALAIMAGIAFWPAVLKVFNRYLTVTQHRNYSVIMSW